MSKKSKRDNCVSMIYKLENDELPVGRRFSDFEEARYYINFVTASPLWQNDGRLPKFIALYSRGDEDSSEAREPNEIWIATKQLNQQVILHELAHFYPPADGHGPRFVRAYLTLVEYFMGLEYARQYHASFRREGIRF